MIGEYINRLGQNLVRNSDAKLPFTFQVVEDDVPNAFALPGGFIFVNTGLIKLASEEDELAGAMAHEIAHVAARHMTCQATKGQIVEHREHPGEHSAGRRIGRLCGAAGDGRRRADGVPEVEPRARKPRPITWARSISTRRIRPERRDQHLREDRIAAEEQAGRAGAHLLDPSDGRRPDRQNAERDPEDSAGQARIRGQHVGVHGVMRERVIAGRRRRPSGRTQTKEERPTSEAAVSLVPVTGSCSRSSCRPVPGQRLLRADLRNRLVSHAAAEHRVDGGLAGRAAGDIHGRAVHRQRGLPRVRRAGRHPLRLYACIEVGIAVCAHPGARA